MPVSGTWGALHPRPGAAPGPGPSPAGVFGEVHPKSHPVHVPQLNYRLNILFCVIPKSICVHTYLIGRLFLLEWGLVLHLSPHCLEGTAAHEEDEQINEGKASVWAGPGTRPRRRRAWEHRPGGLPSLLHGPARGRGPAACHLPVPGAHPAARLRTPSSCWRSLPRGRSLPGGPPRPAPHLPPAKKPGQQGPRRLLEVREWRSPSALPSRSNRFLLPTLSQG